MGLKNLFDSGRREEKRCDKIAYKIEELWDKTNALSDDELRAKTEYFKGLLKDKTIDEKRKILDEILVEAYSVAQVAAYRVTGMKAFHVQLVGAIAIHGGNIAEMKTGEGKTLTGVFPAYLNALSGDGVHIVTVNEYLAGREANGEIGKIYEFLGLTVGLNLRELDRSQKREVYSKDIIYSTNSELGFDYLRDNMVSNYNEVTQVKGLNYAIIDEVDSILIDDARTPLIISGQPKEGDKSYELADQFTKMLKNEEDYTIDEESRTIALTPNGMEKAQTFYKLENLYDIENVQIVHRINNALKANYIFANGIEYVVQDGEVLIVDQSTGRILKGRQFSEGLHQALEAKEGVKINQETITVATITYQNFFRMYKKLSGMTGTAKTEEEEFRDIYNMYVVEIPTNKPVIRQDMPDLLFLTKEYKFNALVEEIRERHEKGQPILVGTANVETSEYLHERLKKLNLPHEVLNAKNHEREAEIVSHAGEKGAITISTNMAGRGTDIKLGEGVVELGGLAVLGTERFEARRIDNQLRGRSGRQGDIGYSRFFLSTEDDLLIRFGGDSFKYRLASMIRLMNDDDESKPLENKLLTKMVTMAQTKIEGINYDSRKNVLKYDDVIRKQRETFYKERQEVIKAENLEKVLTNIMTHAITDIVDKYIYAKGDFDDQKLTDELNKQIFNKEVIDINKVKNIDDDQDIIKYILDESQKIIDGKLNSMRENLENVLPEDLKKAEPNIINDQIQFYLKRIILPRLDANWRDHIDDMAGFRQGIYLQGYAQKNPLELYQREGYIKFEKLNQKMNHEIYVTAMNAGVPRFQVREENPEEKNLRTNQDLSTVRQGPKTNQNDPFANIGPNDRCPCGSGKKFKFCHGAGRR